MESIVQSLISTLVSGGPQAIIAIMVLILGALLWDRKRMITEMHRKDSKIEKLIDDYYRGNMTLTDSLNSLKLLLYEVKGRLL